MKTAPRSTLVIEHPSWDDTTETHHGTERLPGPADEPTVVVPPQIPAAEPSETHAAVELETADEVLPPRRAGWIAALIAVLALIAVALRPSTVGPGVLVTVASPDDTMQWIRIADASGAVLLLGKPDDSAALAPGTYELSAKVVGRPVATRQLVVDAALELACERRERAAVLCADRSGGTYELVP